MPPQIAVGTDAATAAIHEVCGPDLLIFTRQPWAQLAAATQEQIAALDRQGRTIFVIAPTLDGEDSASETAITPGRWAVAWPLTTTSSHDDCPAWLAALDGLRERHKLVDVFCLFADERMAALQQQIETRWHWHGLLVAASDATDLTTVIAQALPQHFPAVTIILLSYNNPFYTRLTLKSVLEKTRYPRYDVLVVDNASDAATLAMLTELVAAHPRITLIRNERNLGFAGGVNVGLQAASTADVVVLLNDDVLVTPGWLATLVGHLSDLSVGLVGPVTSFTSTAARIPIPYKRAADVDDFARRYTARHAGETFAVEMFPLFCAALRRETIAAIGPLDERFAFGMFEDDDYAVRLHEQGYRIICARDVFVHHFGGTSFTKLDDDHFKTIFATNRQAFEEKWQRTWTPPRR